MIGPGHERPQEGSGDFEDAVLVEFSDLERGVFGLVRLARGPEASSSVLGLLFADGQLVAKQAEVFPAAGITDWNRAAAGGAHLAIEEPLRRWTASFSAAEGGFEVEATAVSEPIDLADPATSAVADEAAVSRYEQLCEIRGEATVGGERRKLAGVGRRVHEWGAPRPPGGGLFRSLYASSSDEALTVTAVRPAGSDGHGDELVGGYLAAGESPPAPFEDARVSTIYDRDGEILKAGLELYMPGDEYPRRASGEVQAATVLQAGGSRLSISFLRWSIQGMPGQGSYMVVSPA